jgi:methyl-accepting chemotaxis protein
MSEKTKGMAVEFSRQIERLGDVINNLDEEIRISRDNIEKVHDRISANEADSQQIKEIVGLINTDITRYVGISSAIISVANQINLLSINASIEAARAGTVGKSFGVVAEEVKNLANKTKISANTAQEINNSITPKIDEIYKYIDNLSASITETGVAMDEVANTTEKMNQELINQINDIADSANRIFNS